MNFDLRLLAVLHRPHEVLLQPINQSSEDALSNYEMGPIIAHPVIQKSSISSISLFYSTQSYMCDVGAFSRPGHKLYEWIDMVKLWLSHFEL